MTSLFLNSREVLGANDTLPAVGYAPLTETERLVLDTEYYLNSSKFKAWFTETGEDVKVMGVRKGGYLTLTVAMPILDRYVESEGRYFQRKETVQEDLWNHLSTCLERLEELMLNLNHLDRWGKGMGGMYLTVLGTLAEDADSVEVGRGNQVNGLIPMNRPSGSEAAPGKNPVSHVGKIYNVLTSLLANRLYNEVPGLKEVSVWMCSRIGEPIDKPQILSVQIRLMRSVSASQVIDPIQRMVNEQVARIPSFCMELAEGRCSVC